MYIVYKTIYTFCVRFALNVVQTSLMGRNGGGEIMVDLALNLIWYQQRTNKQKDLDFFAFFLVLVLANALESGCCGCVHVYVQEKNDNELDATDFSVSLGGDWMPSVLSFQHNRIYTSQNIQFCCSFFVKWNTLVCMPAVCPAIPLN